jgi:hypothetical protein
MANNPANNTVKDLKAQGYKVVKASNGVYHVSKGNKRWEIDLTKEEQKGGVIRFLKSGGGIATVAGVAAVLALGAKVAVDYFNDPSGFASKYLAKGSELWDKAKSAVDSVGKAAKDGTSSAKDNVGKAADYVKDKAGEATKAVTDAAKAALESGKEAYNKTVDATSMAMEKGINKTKEGIDSTSDFLKQTFSKSKTDSK